MTTANRHSRRDFLQGRAAAQALANAVRGRDGGFADDLPARRSEADSTNSHPTANRRSLLMSLRRRAMACEFEVQLAAGRHDGSTEKVVHALDLVESLEDQMTVFRADSELLRINRQAAESPVPVDPRLFAILQLAQRLYRDTDGALDITSGPLSEIWGFSRRQGRLPSDGEIAAALERVGMDRVVLDRADCTVAFRRPGVTLHLNSIGKGYALDRMAELLDSVGDEDGDGVGNYLLHGGRSSVLARGDCPGGARPGWSIGVPHPLRPADRLAELDLVDQALGTSSSGTQFFQHGGRRYGHLLDPRTGWPATGMHSATVVAPTAAEADALSTAFYVMGPEKVGQFCARRPDVVALLVCPTDRAGDVHVSTFGLDKNRLRLIAG